MEHQKNKQLTKNAGKQQRFTLKAIQEIAREENLQFYNLSVDSLFSGPDKKYITLKKSAMHYMYSGVEFLSSDNVRLFLQVTKTKFVEIPTEEWFDRKIEPSKTWLLDNEEWVRKNHPDYIDYLDLIKTKMKK